MSYQVLARKWRPKTFQTLSGQEHVLKALINALDKNRLHHAYLFAGTRGVGKTTIARILAKCLNCETGITSKPCGECSACQEIDSGRFIDLIEVDAASRTKVEDTRELLENVQYAPTRGRYKIYLIDEVHMLSGHSFNALLKTLEEPPPHVMFLLATTDPQKLPVTVLSRCLQFNLKNLSADRIKEYLSHVLTEENIPFEDDALSKLSYAAQGSMRDALSLLDQAIAFTHSNINTKDIGSMLGTIEQTHIEKILKALASHDAKRILQISNELTEFGADFNNVLEELLSALHQIAIAQLLSNTTSEDDNEQDFIKELSHQISPEDVQLYYQIGLLGRRDLNIIQNTKSGFEMTLIRMLAFKPFDANKEAPTQRIVTKNTCQVSDKPKTVSDNLNWDQLVGELPLSSMAQALALNCSIKSSTKSHIELNLAPKHSALLNEKVRARLNNTIDEHFGSKIKLEIHITEPEIETPAAKATRLANEQHKAALDTLQQDPTIQAMIDQMGASLDPQHVKPAE